MTSAHPSPLRDWFGQVASWPDAVLPEYAGGSIANLPATILESFGIPWDSPEPSMLPPVGSHLFDRSMFLDARVVVLLVIDGLGQESLTWAHQRSAIDFLNSATHASTLTSVFPSTTAAALTTLQTGLSPAQHGMAGYTMYLETLRATINMITWKPVGGLRTSAPLPKPAGFLGVPTIYTRLRQAGIDSTVVSNLAFTDSALTNVLSAGEPYSGHRTPAELAGLLLAETRKPGKRFIFGYWDGFDALAHTHGPHSDICLQEVYLLDQALGRGFLSPLAEKESDVVVFVVSDHGHSRIAPEQVRSLKSLLARYSSQKPVPTGDRRAAGLAFDDPEAVARLHSLAGDRGVILPVADAIEHGFYGPGEAHADLNRRIGKTLLLARDQAAFTHPHSNNPTSGGHGSLTSTEMLVPLLAWRF